MINSFGTTFEAREDKLQIENAFHGECIDFVAKVTTDGVPNELQYYTVHGMYQAADTLSADVWYPIQAALSGNSVVLHWTPANELGSDSYLIYCLMEKPNETAYPLVWRLNLQHSPGYPANPVDPIPHQIDFSQYDLLNAPWIEATETDTEWVVDKIIKVAGLDLDSLSAQDVVIAGGSLFDAVSSINANIDLLSNDVSEGFGALSNDLTTCCDGMNSKVDSLSATMGSEFTATNAKIDAIVIPEFPTDYAKESTLTAIGDEIVQSIGESVGTDISAIKASVAAIDDKATHISSDVASIKTTVEGIVIPDDYATATQVQNVADSIGHTEDALEALSTHSDAISASLNASLSGVSSTALRIESMVDAITIPTDYAKEATLSVVSANVLSTYNKANSAEQGVWMVKDCVDNKSDLYANVLSAANKATNNNALLNDYDIGLESIKFKANDIFAAITDDTYGLHNIENIVDNIQNYVYEIPSINNTVNVIAYDLVRGIPSVKEQIADSSTVLSTAVKASNDMLSSENFGLTAIRNIAENAYSDANTAKTMLQNSTYGLNAIKTEVSNAKSFAQSTFNLLNSGATKQKLDTIDSRLTDSTNGLSAIKNAINALPTSFPTDYAKQSTLNAIGSTLAQVTTPKVAIIEATVNDSVYGNEAIKNNIDSAYAKMLAIESQLGDCAEALDIINGEVL